MLVQRLLRQNNFQTSMTPDLVNLAKESNLVELLFLNQKNIHRKLLGGFVLTFQVLIEGFSFQAKYRCQKAKEHILVLVHGDADNAL